MKKLFILSAFISGYAIGQTDSIHLKEVILIDPFLENHYKSQSQIRLNDSILKKNQPMLSHLIQFEAPIYIKENGLGMVSSPSFRGTTASQTAIIWNGININSSINGQADFSVINAKTYDEILVKPGGGSIAYGTGAIGGSIHLNDNLKFDQLFTQKLAVGYGSFDTYHVNYNMHFAKKNLVTNVGYARFQSDNDYPIDNYMDKNRNGKYYLNTIDASVGIKQQNHKILLLSQANFGKREFSLSDIYETPTKYHNQDFRLMGQWLFDKKNWKSDLKLAFINESNQYYANINTDNTQDLEVDNWIAKYYLSYKIANNQSISLFTENTFSTGKGTNLENSERNTFGTGIIYKYNYDQKFSLEASARQDFSSIYKIPLIYALGINYNPIDKYQLRFNFSKNYRIPTFNDLFWETGGNPDLKAENALQFELGNDFKYQDLKFKTNIFYNNIKDMIQWIPNAGSALWSPVNYNHVKTYGFELIGEYKWDKISLKALYSFTKSVNQETQKSLIYVPKQLISINANYTWNSWNLYIQNRWVDKVFTQSDNHAFLPSYWITNLGVEYLINKNITTNVSINNIFNQTYQSVANRWMPGINYHISLNFKL